MTRIEKKYIVSALEAGFNVKHVRCGGLKFYKGKTEIYLFDYEHAPERNVARVFCGKEHIHIKDIPLSEFAFDTVRYDYQLVNY